MTHTQLTAHQQTSATDFLFRYWNAQVTRALDKRERLPLVIVRDTAQSLMDHLSEVNQVRATVLIARAEAGLRWIGGRHV